MPKKDNAAQEVVADLLADPDKDVERRPAPLPPQTTEAEPTSDRPGQHRVAEDEAD